MKRIATYTVSMLLIIFLMTNCSGGYSFTGGDVGEAKTFSVDLFPNYAQIINPNLSLLFTEKLKDIILQQTPLKLKEEDGDLHFEGSIVEYSFTPLAPQGNQAAAQTRFTISVKVQFTNRLDSKKNFEERFSRFVDFPADVNLAAIENQLIDQINRELAENILNRAIVNW
ncbi:LptE family protein [Schleiferia thermophila]|uniref:LptE family protein n=1 Tax=Schleiferia thermophila TaxID=884107 RepID=UPI002FDAF650